MIVLDLPFFRFIKNVYTYAYLLAFLSKRFNTFCTEPVKFNVTLWWIALHRVSAQDNIYT